MKRFVLRLILFSVPVLCIIALFEIIIRNGENAFTIKAREFNSSPRLDVIVLGSSHNQTAVNPMFLNAVSANVAYGSQDLKLDYELLKKAFLSKKQPKIVIAEIAYHSLLRENPKQYWRNGLYEHFYGLDLQSDNFLGRYILMSSNLKFFKQYLLERVTGDNTDEFNQWGFVVNDYEGIFQNRKYDSLAIQKDARVRLKQRVAQEASNDVVNRNTSFLKKINELCKKNDAKLILVTPPVYATHRQLFTQNNLHIRKNIVKELKERNPEIMWLNFESSAAFTLKDYKNDDHLNSTGASKFTKMLLDSLKNQSTSSLVAGRLTKSM